MAGFVPPVNPTNDPSYLGYSRGTDNASLQPLATVPNLETKYVQPDYKANTSLGKLFENVGEGISGGVKLADAIIKKDINDTVTKGIDNIRDSFGVAAAADQRTGLAQAAGQAGTENDQKLIPDKPDQPLALQRLGTKIDGLYEAYQEGKLSNSAYYAKMESFVRQTKAQFPGYQDDVDDMVRSKLGVTPANALRSALQDDVAKLAAKVQANNDKWTKWEQQNSDVISTVYGGYENYQKLRSEGKVSSGEVEARVANYNARKLQDDADMRTIALADAQDKRTGNLAQAKVTIGMSNLVSQSITNISDQLGLTNFNQYLQDVRSGKRPLPSPDEKVALAAQFASLEQGVNNALDQYLDAPVFDASNHSTTRRALIRDPNAIASMKTAALSSLQQIKKGLFGNEEPSLMGYEAFRAKASQDAATTSVLNSFPQLLAAAAFREKVGDDLTYKLYTDSPSFTNATIQGLRQANWERIAKGGYSVQRTLDDFRNEGVNDPALNERVFKDTQVFIEHPELLRDKSVQKQAVEHLFGPENRIVVEQVLAKSGRSAATKLFVTATNPDTVKAISGLDAKSKQTFLRWAEDAWPTVYNTEVDNANQATEGYKLNGNLSLKYDPSSGVFRYEGRMLAPAAMVNAANSKISGLNAAIQSMKNVWSLNGSVDITQKLFEWLPAAGIAPGTPIYKALQDEVKKKETETKSG